MGQLRLFAILFAVTASGTVLAQPAAPAPSTPPAPTVEAPVDASSVPPSESEAVAPVEEPTSPAPEATEQSPSESASAAPVSEGDTVNPGSERSGATIHEPEAEAPKPTQSLAPAKTDGTPMKGVVPTDDSSMDEHEQSRADDEEDKEWLPKPAPNQGYYLSAGVSLAMSAAFDPDRPTRGPTLGAAYNFRWGEAVTEWVDLGLEIGLAPVGGDDPWTYGRLSFDSRWYPSDLGFINASFGIGGGGGVDPYDADYSRGRYGEVYLLGIGTNIFLSDESRSGGWILSPVATFEVGPDENFTTTGLWLGLQVAWWSGLDQDKLELSIEDAYRRPVDD